MTGAYQGLFSLGTPATIHDDPRRPTPAPPADAADEQGADDDLTTDATTAGS
jgi:hypothetical protein